MKLHVSRCIVLYFALALSLFGPAPAALGIYATMNDGHTYGLIEGIWDWTLAEYYARLYGGHLATIDDMVENQYIRGAFSDYCNYAWIGLKYSGASSTNPLAWNWASTEQPLPIFRRFATGYPRQGVEYDQAYAYMKMADGRWYDYYPFEYFPTCGVYELDRVSAVPIATNLSAWARATAGTQMVENFGTNSVYAETMDSVWVPYPENPEEGEWVSCSANASLDCGGGSWGARIQAHLTTSYDPGGFMPMSAEAVAEIKGGTIDVGATDDVPAGTPLRLMIQVNAYESGGNWWSLSILRDGETLLEIKDADAAWNDLLDLYTAEGSLTVHAGDSLGVEFQGAAWNAWDNKELVVNFWAEPVPEPGALALIVAGLAGAWTLKSVSAGCMKTSDRFFARRQ